MSADTRVRFHLSLTQVRAIVPIAQVAVPA